MKMKSLNERSGLSLPKWMKQKEVPITQSDLENEIIHNLNIWDKKPVRYNEIPIDDLLDWKNFQKKYKLDSETINQLKDYTEEVVEYRQRMGYIHAESVKGIIRKIIMDNKNNNPKLSKMIQEEIERQLLKESIETGKYYKPNMKFLKKKLIPQQMNIIKRMLKNNGKGELLVLSQGSGYVDVAGWEGDSMLGSARIPVEGLISESRQLWEQKNGRNELKCGFSIQTFNEDILEDNWGDITYYGYEEMDEDEQILYDKYTNEDGELNQQAWDDISDDALKLENNVMKWLKNKYDITLQDEGHDNFGERVGTCWVDRDNKEAYEFIMDRNEHSDHYDAVIQQSNDYNFEELFQGLSGIGKRLLDFEVMFFDIDQDEYETWEDTQ